MHFGLTEEQRLIRDTARGFLSRLPSARSVLEGAPADDPSVWARICEEQAWQCLLVGEDDGGFGLGIMDMAVVLEEVGRLLLPCPLLETALATLALRAAAPAAPRDAAIQAILDGAPATVAFRAAEAVHAGRLEGTVDAVIGAQAAQVLVAEVGADVVLLDGTRGWTCTPRPPLDVTRPVARVTFQAAPCTRLDGVSAETLRAEGAILVAAEALGAAEATLEMAVEYARVRHQFGKPIGSFQAIQHKCADMMVLVESARSAVWYAAWAMDSGAADAILAAHTAKAMASDAFTRCAGENIQIHGGIGFTWEHDAHLYFKRARSTHDLLGSPRMHRAAVADAVLGAL